MLRISLTLFFLVQQFLWRGSPWPVDLRLPSEKRRTKARPGDMTLLFEIETWKNTNKQKTMPRPVSVG